MNVNHLKLVFPFLEYTDILSFLCSSHVFYDSLIHETRQVSLLLKGLVRLLNDQSFVLNKIVDPSKQLSVKFNDNDDNTDDQNDDFSGGKEALLQSVQSFFPYFILTPSLSFPPLHKLSCGATFYIYLCEVYPSFTVQKLEIFEDELVEGLATYLSPHLTHVLEELVLNSWPSRTLPQLSPSLLSLTVRNSRLDYLPPLPNLKHLHLDNCNNSKVDLTLYNLESLTLIQPKVLDFAKIGSCKKLTAHCPVTVKNMRNAKQFQQIEFAEVDIKDLPEEAAQSVKDLKLIYEEVGNDDDDDEAGDVVVIDLSSFSNLERFELTGCGGEEEDSHVTLQVTGEVPPHLKVVGIFNYAGNLNLSWFSKVREITLLSCPRIISLLGLEKVPRVILKYLPLQSLEGLGAGNFVEVTGCDVEDFSPLQSVREVRLKYCRRFRNGADIAHVKKLSIIRCIEIEDLSGLIEVEDLLLEHCDNVVYCENFEKIPKFRFTHCKRLRHPSTTPIENCDFGVREIGDKDGLSSLPDSLYPEIMRCLEVKEMWKMITSNTHFYQRYSKFFLYPSSRWLYEPEEVPPFLETNPPYVIETQEIRSRDLEIPRSVKKIRFNFCRFACSPNFPQKLRSLHLINCDGMKNITDFCEAEEVFIQGDYSANDEDYANVKPLNGVKRLTLDSVEDIIDFSPLQDVEEVTINRFATGTYISFQGQKAFSNTKKMKLYFEFNHNIELDLAFYQSIEVFDLSGGTFCCNGPCPPRLRKLSLSRLDEFSFPEGLDHLHQLHIFSCLTLTSLHGLGSIPNIKLALLPNLKSLEGLGPGNHFVQLLSLSAVADFSAVSGCRKVVIWNCPKFTDASAFREANYLVIGKCRSLVDVSMLGRVKHLELIDCDNILSLNGLKGVNELIVKDCRLLEDVNNTRHRAWTVSPESLDPDHSLHCY